MTGRPRAELVVSDEDRAMLMRWTARHTTTQHLATRARIILRCATGNPNMAVAQEVGVADQTVCKWRGRFVKRLPSSPRRARLPATRTTTPRTTRVLPPLRSLGAGWSGGGWSADRGDARLCTAQGVSAAEVYEVRCARHQGR